MIIAEENLKVMFVEMCKHIVIDSEGIICLYENIELDNDFEYIVTNENYPLLKKKMQNLLEIVNKDYSLIEKDIETELWDLI